MLSRKSISSSVRLVRGSGEGMARGVSDIRRSVGMRTRNSSTGKGNELENRVGSRPNKLVRSRPGFWRCRSIPKKFQGHKWTGPELVLLFRFKTLKEGTGDDRI